MADKNCTIGVMIHDSYTDYTKEMISGISTFCTEKNCRILVFPVGELGISYSQIPLIQKKIKKEIKKEKIKKAANNIKSAMFGWLSRKNNQNG